MMLNTLSNSLRFFSKKIPWIYLSPGTMKQNNTLLVKKQKVNYIYS